MVTMRAKIGDAALRKRRLNVVWGSLFLAASVIAAPDLPVHPGAAPAASLAASAAISIKAPNIEPADRALAESSQLITTQNLAVPVHVLLANGTVNSQELEKMLEDARRLRKEKSYSMAMQMLREIMRHSAPPAIHQSAMLELAVVSQQSNQLLKAQQIYAQYVRQYPGDASVAEVYLRQGLIYRQLGAIQLAMAKFYGVMNASLNLKSDQFEYYQKLVIQAKAEIADTFYLQGHFGEAANFYALLLKETKEILDRAQIQYKWIRSLSYLNHNEETVAQAHDYLNRYGEHGEAAEVRFLLAAAYKQMNRNRDALKQVFLLLDSQARTADQNPETWLYWKRRTGNEIANQLYREGDYAQALEVYMDLGQIDTSAAWQLPVWYQIGLVYERLKSPRDAVNTYARIVSREPEVSTNGTPGLKAILDMAKWRREFLGWQETAEKANQELAGGKVSPPAQRPDP